MSAMSDVIRRNGDALKAIICCKLCCIVSAKRERCTGIISISVFNQNLECKCECKIEVIDNEDVESAAKLRYSAIINPLRGGHVSYGHYDETEKPLQSYDWYSEIRRGE